MSKVIGHIRTFARQDLQKFTNMSVNESTENALELMGEQLRLHNIEIVKNLDLTLNDIMGEPYQIEQVIINVISNAKDSIDEKESNYPKKVMGWTKRLEVKTFSKNNWVCIEITDSGCGMTDESKEKIFHLFFTTKEVGKATGLGMAISFGIIENHNGRTDINSKLGEGTTISIKLPINKRS